MVKPMTGLPLWADSLAYYWSVSQMDGNGNCTCSHCMALDKYDGSPSGSILNYVNKVAAQFPDKRSRRWLIFIRVKHRNIRSLHPTWPYSCVL